MSKLSQFVKNVAELGHRRVRKNPRIHPKAKSKLFKIREPVPIDPVEAELLTKWWTDYRLQYNAIKSLFQYEVMQHDNQVQASIRTDDASDRVRRSNLAESWNKQTRLKALDQLSELRAKLVQQQNNLVCEFDAREQEAERKLSESMETVVTHSGQFITRENMDDKIDEVLNAEIVDYNFLVDQSGKIVRGSSSKSPSLPWQTDEPDQMDSPNLASATV